MFPRSNSKAISSPKARASSSSSPIRQDHLRRNPPFTGLCHWFCFLEQLDFLNFFLFLLNGFLRFWLVFCFLDFGFVVGCGGGVVVVVVDDDDDGDGCDESEKLR